MGGQTSEYSRLWDLIKDIRFGMLTAPHRDGGLRSRPMTTQNGKDDRGRTPWFFAARSGEAALPLTQAVSGRAGRMATAAATGRKPDLKTEHGEIGRR
jgi:hypothetical protein